MKFKFLAIALAFIAQASVAKAASVDQVFASTFYSGYRDGYCGDNILNLVKRSNEAGADVSRAKILTITNKGTTVFGMVNAEYVRNKGRILTQPTPEGLKWAPGEANWYHHVVLELDGEIYDFDFGNKPVVAGVQAYFDKMFIDERPKDQGGKFFADPGDKLADYEIETLSAQDYLKRVEKPTRLKMKLKDYLKR